VHGEFLQWLATLLLVGIFETGLIPGDTMRELFDSLIEDATVMHAKHSKALRGQVMGGVTARRRLNELIEKYRHASPRQAREGKQ
jgi:hypothetical protein